jgi:hypothetical protein
MSRIRPECLDSESPDPLIGVLVRDEPDDEEDEEEDDGEEEDGEDKEDEGYSE